MARMAVKNAHFWRCLPHFLANLDRNRSAWRLGLQIKMADDFVVPVVSLDDLLVGQQRSTRDQHRRLLFPRCNSTAEERDCVERHVRRCLRCPLTPGAPSQSFRKELLAAIVEELNCCIDGDSGAPAPSSPEMESPLTGIEAARHALADVQFSIAECKSAASRVKAGNNARWWAAERSRWLSRAAELDKLAAPLRAQFAVSAAPAAATEPTSAKRTFSAGKAEKGGKLKSAATGIRRALSFDRNSKGASREELHPVARGGSKDDLHTPPTTTANGGDENGGSKSSSNRAARSLSFERFRKKLGSAKKEKPAEAATPSEPASENKKKSKAAMLRAAARFATGIKKPDKGSEEPPPSSPWIGGEQLFRLAPLCRSTDAEPACHLDFGGGRPPPPQCRCQRPQTKSRHLRRTLNARAAFTRSFSLPSSPRGSDVQLMRIQEEAR